ncbi:hypothetical protein JCM21900_004854 [Sporobolomyces salmonicolor]
MANLYDSDSESDAGDLPAFTVNEHFAQKYDTKKRGEELSKLQDKYGKDYRLLSDDDDDDSEDLSDDDSDAELVTPQVDAAILRTLARIKAKDPSVYEPDKDIFEEEESRTAAGSNFPAGKKSSTSSKPVLLKDYQRSRLLANPEGDDALDSTIPTPAQEQRALKSEITAAFHAGEDSDEDEDADAGLFRKRERGDDERAKEEREYEKFLETHVGKKAVKEALANEEAFLRDYILNRGWIDRENDKTHIPSYDEIVGESSSKKKKGKSKLLDDDKPLDPSAVDGDDEEYDEKAEEFEHKYNFRFEEEAGSSLVTHSRDAVSTVRRQTAVVSARARQREAAKLKKEEEKQQRKEEVRRLKALKRKEVEDKLLQLVEAAGAGTKGLEELDLEGDWDEQKHEEAMRKVYGEDYEGVEDDGFKPTWDDDIDITDIVGADGGSDDEDGDLHMPFASTSALPASASPEPEEVESKKSKKEKRKKGVKRDEEGFPTELLEKAKEGGDEERQKMLDRMVDEYYGIEYEDKVGDVKTRFRYAKVAPSSYNLTPEEILLATDAELNAFMSLKKLAPYRQGDADAHAAKQKKKLQELRAVLRNRKWGEEVDEEKAQAELERRKERKRKWKSEGEGKDKVKDASGGTEGGGAGGAGEREAKKRRAGKSERKRLQAERAAQEAAAAGGA